MKGNAALATSTAGKSAPMTSRERGPTTGKVAHCSVTEVQRTRSSGHSVWSHSSIQSSTFAAPPVVVMTRKRSSARRSTVPSSMTMPSMPHMTPYRTAPAFSVLIMFV